VGKNGGVTMSDGGASHIVFGLVVVAVVIVLLIRTGIAAKLCAAWCIAAMIGRAILFVPLGLGLLVLAFVIGVNSLDNWLGLLLAGWIAYHGGNWVFGSLMGFVGASKSDESGRATTASRATLRRRGLFGRS
jgi:hypothetical protein